MTRSIRFGTDGWRGIVGDDFTYEAVRLVAQGTAEHLRSRGAEPLAVVGYDCRFASEVFAEDVARVLAGNGVRTLLFERPAPTPVGPRAAGDRGAPGGAGGPGRPNP